MEDNVYYIDNYDFCIKKIHSDKKNKDYYALVFRKKKKDIILCFLYNSVAEEIINYLK